MMPFLDVLKQAFAQEYGGMSRVYCLELDSFRVLVCTSHDPTIWERRQILCIIDSSIMCFQT
jgi:hypothetical protein